MSALPVHRLDPDDRPLPAVRQEWTREQVEIIKRTVAVGTSDDELALFLETARRRGLDPFAGQIHAIMRYDSREGRKVMSIQTGIDGYRAIADRTKLVEWVAGPEWTADGETWLSVWLSEYPPAAARFTVKRRDRTQAETRVATWLEYQQTNSKGELTHTWKTLGATMLGKCAEAAAYRSALPEQLGGIYTAEEMDQAHTLDAGAEPIDQRGGPPVDSPEERQSLYDRFAVAGVALREAAGEEAAMAVHREVVAPRLRGRNVKDGFEATPLYVLEEVVEAFEARARDAAASPTIPTAEAGERACVHCGLPMRLHGEGPPPGACQDAAAAADVSGAETPPVGDGTPPVPSPPVEPSEAGRDGPDAPRPPSSPASEDPDRLARVRALIGPDGMTPDQAVAHLVALGTDPADAAELVDAALPAPDAPDAPQEDPVPAPQDAQDGPEPSTLPLDLPADASGAQEPSQPVAPADPDDPDGTDWRMYQAVMASDARSEVAKAAVEEVVRRCADGEWQATVTLAVELAAEKPRRTLIPRLTALCTAPQAALARRLAERWAAQEGRTVTAADTLAAASGTLAGGLASRAELSRRLTKGLLALRAADPDAARAASAALADIGSASSAELPALAAVVDDIETALTAAGGQA